MDSLLNVFVRLPYLLSNKTILIDYQPVDKGMNQRPFSQPLHQGWFFGVLTLLFYVA
jgi:hypothetical protein